MKKIINIISIIFLLQASYSQENNMIEEIEKITNNNIAFYKGNIGTINRVLFIKKDDRSNVIYSKPNKIVFKGEKHKMQIIKIKQQDNEMLLEQVDSIDGVSPNFFLVFSEDATYVLNFKTKEFCKYIRNDLFFRVLK